MQTLNPIQILDIRDCVKAELENKYNKLKGRGSSQVLLSNISNLEKTLPILDAMFTQAVENENRIYASVVS
jgi:DNA-binding protein Fis